MLKSPYSAFILEGVDRLGKDTLITNIQRALGRHFVLHYSKPQKLPCYKNSLEEYQRESFHHGFGLLESVQRSADNYASARHPVIFNRFHLGEAVYADLYRGYKGDYVFEMENIYDVQKFRSTKLILLTTSDFSFIQDDGESFDFSKKEQEQEIFKNAFAQSSFPRKAIIDVSANGTYRDPFDILLEAIS